VTAVVPSANAAVSARILFLIELSFIWPNRP
jgi:hypothetical protein